MLYIGFLRIALDATYQLGDALSGVGVYSREILNGVAASAFADALGVVLSLAQLLAGRGVPNPAT